MPASPFSHRLVLFWAGERYRRGNAGQGSSWGESRQQNTYLTYVILSQQTIHIRRSTNLVQPLQSTRSSGTALVRPPSATCQAIEAVITTSVQFQMSDLWGSEWELCLAKEAHDVSIPSENLCKKPLRMFGRSSLDFRGSPSSVSLCTYILPGDPDRMPSGLLFGPLLWLRLLTDLEDTLMSGVTNLNACGFELGLHLNMVRCRQARRVGSLSLSWPDATRREKRWNIAEFVIHWQDWAHKACESPIEFAHFLRGCEVFKKRKMTTFHTVSSCLSWVN